MVLTHLTTPVRLRVPDLTQQAPGGRSVRFAEDGLTVEFAAPGG